MYRKLLISSIIIAFAIFSFSTCFANSNNGIQDAVNGVRNVVGGAENAVEDAAKDISNTSKDVTNDIGNTMMENGDNNNTQKDTNNNTSTGMMTNNNSTTGMMNNNYTATRTATTDNTFMGMNATAWTWLIIGIAAIAIVALVWYYSMQIRSTNYDNRD